MNKKRFFIYLVTLQLPLQTLLSFTFEVFYLSPIVVFIVIPIIDQWLGDDKYHYEMTVKNKNTFYKIIILLWLPLQLMIFVYAGWLCLQSNYSLFDKFFIVLSTGIVSGSGIIIAHEFGHRSSLWEKLVSKLLLYMVVYSHFTLEHNYGHHKRVATFEDPATARMNESIYKFLPRTIIMGYLHALHLARKYKTSFYINSVLLDNLIHVTIIIMLYYISSWSLVLAFLLQAFMAISMLELINYVEHYGLTRKEISTHKYEKVTAMHSWNANKILTNIYMINLPRHSDHHLHPAKTYQQLNIESSVPQLPWGYGIMFLLAFIPSLWFRIMNPKAIDIRNQNVNQ